jgi:hypothetical protein
MRGPHQGPKQTLGAATRVPYYFFPSKKIQQSTDIAKGTLPRPFRFY